MLVLQSCCIREIKYTEDAEHKAGHILGISQMLIILPVQNEAWKELLRAP